MLSPRAGAIALVALAGACAAFGAASSESPRDVAPNDGGSSRTEAGADAAPCVFSDVDPKNCGRCGHDCLGGECVAGVCQPHEVAGGLDTAFYMAVDDEAVYLTGNERPGVSRIEKSTGARRFLSQRKAFGIAVDDSYVYFCALGGGVFRVDKESGAGEVRLSIEGCAECVSRDGVLFATDFDGRQLRRSLPDGGARVVLHEDAGTLEGLAVDDTHVFFTSHSGGQLLTVGRQGAGVKVLDSRPKARRVAIDDTHVYWLAYGSPEVYRVRKDGADISTVATGPGATGAGGVAVDDAWVYWIVSLDQGGALLRAPKAATDAAPEVLVGELEKPIDVKVDGDAVYFTVEGVGLGQGRLMRLAKP